MESSTKMLFLPEPDGESMNTTGKFFIPCRREILALLATQGTMLLHSADSQPSLNRFPHMVHEYFVRKVRESEKANIRAIGELKTREDAQKYVADAKARIQKCFGTFPEKTPLNARVTGKVERKDYNIEKVLFESRPGFLVSANLYVPKNRKFPLPGVVGSCGHSNNGKAADAYQSFAQGLARMGYVVLIFDPIGQGERLQYGHVEGKSRPRVGVGEHLHGGNQQFLVGEFLGSWRAWDGIRALDYLLTRPEVDPSHVGITGNSGGGTMTTWLCGVESRWTMAAPSCFVTTFRRNLENELPADTEQCPPMALALNLDHSDFLAAMAPKPVAILAKERDFFDVRGAQEAYQKLSRLYKLLEKPENLKLFIGPTEHGYSKENREAMYQWFNQVTKISNQASEPELVIEKDETLACTPSGQVSEFNSRTVFSFTRQKAIALSKSRSARKEKIGDRIKQVLKMPPLAGEVDYRILRNVSSKLYPKPVAAVYAIETEPGIHAVVSMLSGKGHDSRPPRGAKKAVLYISHHSADQELREEALVKSLVQQNPESLFFACDVRGIGESRPDTCGKNQFLSQYGSDYFYAVHSLMLDSPYLGQKTFDVLRVIQWLRQEGLQEIQIAGFRWGSLPALFAAILDGGLTRVTLKNPLKSYEELATSECYDWPLSCMLPNVLEHFDLPECYASLGEKLQMLDPLGAMFST